jgi:hypothetical protein
MARAVHDEAMRLQVMPRPPAALVTVEHQSNDSKRCSRVTVQQRFVVEHSS